MTDTQHPGHRIVSELKPEGRCLAADLIDDRQTDEAVEIISFATACSDAEAKDAIDYIKQHGIEL